MTEVLYNEDCYLKEFDGKIVSIAETVLEKKKCLAVITDRTCFFPEEGGQDSDTGVIDAGVPNYGEVRLNVFHTGISNGTVTHYCICENDADKNIISELALMYDQADDKCDDSSNSQIDSIAERGCNTAVTGIGEAGVDENSLPAGKTVTGDGRTDISCHGIINWEVRYDKMQQHSGEHIVSGIVNRMFGYSNVGFHLGAEEVTMDYDGVFTEDEIREVERQVNRAVMSNVRCIISYPTKEELKNIAYRSKKEIDGQVRLVEFEGVDICACCAPHVRLSGEIGLVKIISAEHFRGGTRMTIKCGMRALDDYNDRLESCREISRLISVKPEAVAGGTKKLYEDYRKVSFETIGLQTKMMNLLTENAVKENPGNLLFIFTEGFNTDVIRKGVNSLVEMHDGFCGCFNGNDENGYSFIIAAKNSDCNVIMKVLRDRFAARGGGKSDMIQGSIAASRADIMKLEEVM